MDGMTQPEKEEYYSSGKHKGKLAALKISNAQLNLPSGEHSPWFKAQWTQETSQSNVKQIRRNNHPPKTEEEEEKNYVTSFKLSLQGGCRLGPSSLPKSN
jgi:hypothetical protein